MFAPPPGKDQHELRSWGVRYRRMPIEVESPEQLGYDTITNNLSESSVADRRLSDLGIGFGSDRPAAGGPALDDLLLCYGDHLGDPVLREAVAAGGPGLTADDVIVTPGAAAALFATATSLLEPGDHAVVVRTNYATNLETPRAIGADLDVVDLAFDEGWRLDVDRVGARVRPGSTRLISVTCPHNPTGTVFDLASMQALVALAERTGAVLLVDETYRDLTHGDALPMAATLSTRAISVSSMSKAYGLPGLRVGWAVCRDPQLAETLLAAKEQIVICGSTIDESIASRVLSDRARLLPPILDEVRTRLDIVRDWMRDQGTFEWIEPAGGVVGLVRFTDAALVDIERFYDVLLADHGTYVGPGHWFELDDRHFRLGFGWPAEAELRAGLAALSASAEQARPGIIRAARPLAEGT
jgi:aspartate/methionine/tyrosine aminotransferase